jgi:hypothetical protein
MKLLKCEFGVTEVDFLEYHIGVVGVSMNPRRVRTIWTGLNQNPIKIFRSFLDLLISIDDLYIDTLR